MKDSLVSVIIPSYKNISFLCRAIESVVSQTYKPIEIIVVDDNDPDSSYRIETEKALQRYSQNRNIIYIQNEHNSERSFSRNNGFNHSHGEYVAFLDNDDEFFPNKVQRQVQRLEELGPDYVVCYSRYIRTKEGKVICTGEERREGDLTLEVMARDLPIHPGSNLLIRRDAFVKTGGFDEQMSYNEDIDMLIKLLKYGKIACDDEVGLTVHLHGKGQHFNFEIITDEYIEKEKALIAALAPKEKQLLYSLIGLQLVKYYVGKPKKMRIEARKYNVRLIDIVRYFRYLLVRAITKKAYGYTSTKRYYGKM